MPIPTSKLKDVAFSSGFNYEHIYAKGTINTTLGSTVYIPHTLGYAPYVKVFYLFPGAGAFQASSSPYSPYSVIVAPQTLNIQIDVLAGLFGTFGSAVTLYYRIYKEQAI